jgi:acetyl esterase/lipase
VAVADHEYAGDDDVRLTLRVFAPTAASRETAVLLVHGGGWRAGSPQSTHQYAHYLAAHGFTAIAVQYRLLTTAPWPTQLHDILSALHWVVTHAAELGVRRDRIVLQGFSAGAHLSLLAGARAHTPIAAIVAFFAPSRLAIDAADAGEVEAEKLLGPSPNASEAEAASPITHLGGSFPPTFFLHGNGDWMVSPKSSIRMYEKLADAGVVAELHLVAGGHHEFCSQPSMLAPTMDEVISFLVRIVVDPKAHALETETHNPFAKGPAYIAQLAAEGAHAKSRQGD